MNSNQLRILAAGFVGGIATPAIQPMQAFLKTHHYPSEFTAGYWIFGIILGGVGLILVWVLQETEAKKALALGASLPAFLTSLGGAVQNDQKLSDASARVTINAEARSERWADAVSSIFVSTASAQSPAAVSAKASPAESDRTASVTRTAPFAYKVEVLDAGGNKVAPVQEVNALVSSPVKVELPPNAASLRFTTESGASSTQKINAGSEATEVTLRGEDFHRRFDAQQLFGKAPDLVPNQLKTEAAGQR